MMIFDYLKGKRVLLTGNTGFKGSWMCCILNMMGAEVYGYSDGYPTEPALFKIAGLDSFVRTEMGDVADYDHLHSFFEEVRPDVVIHMAAQPIVLEGYRDPRRTYESNVMGTVNILECVRQNGKVKSFLNVTTDKVYDNLETDKYYKETDRLDGYDPYSNSKSCSELVTHSYIRSFFGESDTRISTARAGNVIGGGDFADNRIVPDCVRAVTTGNEIIVRNPNSIRPYQHVLEPLYAYLTIVCRQAVDKEYAGSYNVGPEKADCITTGALASKFCEYWGPGAKWKALSNNGPHEANFLKLDNTLLKEKLGVSPLWCADKAIEETVRWTKGWQAGEDCRRLMETQIREYFKGRSIEL